MKKNNIDTLYFYLAKGKKILAADKRSIRKDIFLLKGIEKKFALIDKIMETMVKLSHFIQNGQLTIFDIFKAKSLIESIENKLNRDLKLSQLEENYRQLHAFVVSIKNKKQ